MSGEQQQLISVGQHQLTSDDYYTPRWVFDALALRFDVDVCSPPGGVEWIPADKFYTVADDGLSQRWEGRVWMNPPFSDCGRWVQRFIEHRNGVCLVQVSKSRHSEALWATADATAFVGGFPFVASGGGAGHVFMPCWFAAFGEECVEALSRVGVVRSVYVPAEPKAWEQ